jgi:hypothetical protein
VIIAAKEPPYSVEYQQNRRNAHLAGSRCSNIAISNSDRISNNRSGIAEAPTVAGVRRFCSRCGRSFVDGKATAFLTIKSDWDQFSLA